MNALDNITTSMEKHELRADHHNAGDLLSALVEDGHSATAQTLTEHLSQHELLTRSTFIEGFLKDVELEADLSLNKIQALVHEWGFNNFGNNVSKTTGQELGSIAPLIGMGEELGELQHCILKAHQGIRGFSENGTLTQKYFDERDDALADILIYMCDFASRENVNLLEVLNKTWRKIVSKRDWKKNPKEGDSNNG